MVSFPQVCPPNPCMHLFSPPYVLHVLPISFVSIYAVSYEIKLWPNLLRIVTENSQRLGRIRGLRDTRHTHYFTAEVRLLVQVRWEEGPNKQGVVPRFVRYGKVHIAVKYRIMVRAG
jgi:hypothetical protein